MRACAQQRLGAWEAAVNRGDAEELGALFAEDVLFIATAPEAQLGARAVTDYYRNAPPGLQVRAQLRDVLGREERLRFWAAVEFILPDHRIRRGRVSFLTRQVESSFVIELYHAELEPLS